MTGRLIVLQGEITLDHRLVARLVPGLPFVIQREVADLIEQGNDDDDDGVWDDDEKITQADLDQTAQEAFCRGRVAGLKEAAARLGEGKPIMDNDEPKEAGLFNAL